MNWDAIGAITSVCIAFGGMLMVWWKFSKDNAEIRKQTEENTEKIAVILIEKASCADMLKLGELVNSIQATMIAHHTDTLSHRNKDFENRMDALAREVKELAVENRTDHKSILELIAKVTG